MSKLHPVVLAFAVAGSVIAVGACGDDEDTGTPASTSGDDAGSDTATDDENDAGATSSSADAGSKTDAGSTKTDASTTTTTAAAKCPDHPAVTTDGDFCVVSAPITTPITKDLTLGSVKGKKVLLSGPVFVGEDVGGGASKDATKKSATLTIEAGTTVYAEDSTAFLLIQRGSKIEAVGTADKPIVFTTAADVKTPGSWGGLLINGRSLHNKGNDVVGEAGTGSYAGPDADDNSGTLQYLRIEFGGAQLNAENEFNGLTLSGVGSGTTIDHIHVHANNDDGIEFFGGTVNAKYVVSTANGDDGLDWTSGFAGKIQYAVVQQWGSISSTDPRGIEADNDKDNGALAPISNPTLSNITVVGSSEVPGMNAEGAMLRRGTYAQIDNAVFLNFSSSCLRVDGPESQAAIGAGDLAMHNVRAYCAKNFHDTGSQAIFSEANGNEVLDSKDVLEDAYSKTPNFLPKADSGLLTGGKAPTDKFFEAAAFIGAMGEDDWTKEGSWVAIEAF